MEPTALSPVVVNVDQATRPGLRVYASELTGAAARRAAQLNTLDQRNVLVEIRIPEGVYTMTVSFFLGMFGPSIQTLGREKFLEKYRFYGPNFGAVIAQGIADVESSPVHAT